MATSKFYPYRTGDAYLEVDRVTCRIDGKSVAIQWDPDRMEIDLSHFEAWDLAEIVLSLKYPDSSRWVGDLVLDSEQAKPPVQVVATALCGLTLWRRGTIGQLDLERRSGTVTLVLNRQDLAGSVEVSVAIVRDKAQRESVVVAADKAAQLIVTRAVTIRIDPGGSVLAPGLDVEWDSFSRSEDPYRRSIGDALFHLDCAVDPPRLLLNSDMDPNLVAVLKEEAPRGKKAQLRNLVFAAIAVPVWNTLLRQSLGAVEADGSVSPGWQRNVLVEIAEQMFGNEEPESAVRRLVEELRAASTGTIEERLGTILTAKVRLRLQAESMAQAL